jgi:predicted regulator of Ras-like GTPase activity (Roadblock/LC7/MglB family)
MSKDSLVQNVKGISGVNGVMLSSKDGLVVKNDLAGSDDPNMMSAVLSSMVTQVDNQSKRMQRGKTIRFTIETETEVMSVSDLNVEGENLLMLTQASKNVDLDLLNSSLDLMRG